MAIVWTREEFVTKVPAFNKNMRGFVEFVGAGLSDTSSSLTLPKL